MAGAPPRPLLDGRRECPFGWSLFLALKEHGLADRPNPLLFFLCSRLPLEPSSLLASSPLRQAAWGKRVDRRPIFPLLIDSKDVSITDLSQTGDQPDDMQISPPDPLALISRRSAVSTTRPASMHTHTLLHGTRLLLYGSTTPF